VVATAVLLPVVPAAARASDGAGDGAYVLTATSTGGSYAPTFTGNGYVGFLPAEAPETALALLA
jgi:hypothetical protein